MKSFALILIAAVASAVSLESEFQASVLPEQRTAQGYQIGSFVNAGQQEFQKTTRQKGRFVDLCPNAGKCDFSPDQKIGGEILNVDTNEFTTNMQNANLGASQFDYETKRLQKERYDQLQMSKIENANRFYSSSIGEKMAVGTSFGAEQQKWTMPIAAVAVSAQPFAAVSAYQPYTAVSAYQPYAAVSAQPCATIASVPCGIAVQSQSCLAAPTLVGTFSDCRQVGTTTQDCYGGTTTQIRPLGCIAQKVPEYNEKDQPGVNEYAFCGEKNLRGSQTLKRTNLHHNYVHDVNHLHNYHNRVKHQARQFNTVVKDCSCIGESEQVQGCACEADP